MACPPGFFEGPGASGEVGAPGGPTASPRAEEEAAALTQLPSFLSKASVGTLGPGARL